MMEKVTGFPPYKRLARGLPFVLGLWAGGALCFFKPVASPANVGASSRILASNSSEIIVAIPDTSASPNRKLDIPIIVSEASGIAGAEIKVTYDSKILTALDVKKTALTADFVLVDSLTPGEIRILLARATGLAAGGGEFVELTFQVNATALKGDTTTLALATLLLYDENTNPIPATRVNGLFTVSFADHFDDITPSLVNVYSGAVAWGDYDGDDDLDILLTGNRGDTLNPSAFTGIYRNDGLANDALILISTLLAHVLNGAVAWGDFDNDGDLDILLAGDSSGELITRVYHNDNDNFTPVNAALVGVMQCALAWGDYDNDGDLDILLTGNTQSGPVAKIYRNDRGTFADLNAALTAVSAGAVAWGDYDNDGDLDILLTGLSTSGPVSKIYRNDDANFVEATASLTPVWTSAAAWGDYDADGDLDILLAGDAGTGSVAEIYRNNGGTFAKAPVTLIGVRLSSAAWGDFDNDGDLDILLAGRTGANAVTKIYRNNDGEFEDIEAPLESVFGGAVAWGDRDNDKDLDILLTGLSDKGQGIMKAYRNHPGLSNTAPAAPANLAALAQDNTLTLSWNEVVESARERMTYNLRVGTTPGGAEIVAPMSNASSGYRQIPQMGNVNLNTRWTIKNLPPRKYYWSVQAIDNAFVGSGFAESDFTIEPRKAPEAVSVAPNPFTPNNDGFNDAVNFSFSEMFTPSAEVVIFNISGKRVRRLSIPSSDGCKWDGVDDDGRALEPGVYIYLIRSNGKQVANGTVTLMR
ncbi:MAG: FG-GAP-like repeat-containing protein [bacterium]